ncbi:hypothetical protein [Sphingomicrobium astaxanthinifaciens]|uniref:hypothetical protein n=1 Tax=Sphingomicrobium astaxanthinifaciens TaxID=1227949 RepID=UPI001FCC6EE6|nr:hypothetical protein [Sphingomicrobium astaxanthinifaciens]MCJ7422193.1 hypothetical protein [Sphingomicrobium astaxanthinifaciens]
MIRLAPPALAALLLTACGTPSRDPHAGQAPYAGPIEAGPMVDVRYAAAGPNWRLTIEGQAMSLVTDGGLRATDRLLRFTPGHTDGDTYQGERMTLVAMHGRCTIGEQGATYPHRVTVTFGDQVLRGCGQRSIVPPSGRSG